MDINRSELRIERLPQVLRRTGLSRSGLYAAIAKGVFPRPVKLSSRAVGFLSREIDDWILRQAGGGCDVS